MSNQKVTKDGVQVSGWIGVDLDATLATYTGWVDESHIGDPIQPMVDRVKHWVENGIEVRIFTARVWNDPTGERRKAIQEWALEHIGYPLEVTNCKDYGMIELWDDRAIQVVPNTGEPVVNSSYGGYFGY